MEEQSPEVKMTQVNVEGLEHIFELVQDMNQDHSKSEPELVLDQVHRQPEMISLGRAAEISGKARRYLLSLVHKGKLEAIKDDKGAWRVRLDQIQQRSRSSVEVVQEQIQDQHVEALQDLVHGKAFVDIQTILKQLQDATYRNGWLEGQLHTASEQVKLLPDLQAQAARVVAQEIRIKELEENLAHLKGHWWYRFWRWFTGSNVQ